MTKPMSSEPARVSPLTVYRRERVRDGTISTPDQAAGEGV